MNNYQELAMRTNSHSYYPYVFKSAILSDLEYFITSANELDHLKRSIYYTGQTPGQHDSGSSKFLNPDFCDNPKMSIEVLHGILGIASESGELVQNLKATIKEHKFDRVNLVEEVGDILWYCALLCNAVGVTLDDAMKANIEKLKVRYPEKFTSECAHNRNLETEQAALVVNYQGMNVCRAIYGTQFEDADEADNA